MASTKCFLTKPHPTTDCRKRLIWNEARRAARFAPNHAPMRLAPLQDEIKFDFVDSANFSQDMYSILLRWSILGLGVVLFEFFVLTLCKFWLRSTRLKRSVCSFVNLHLQAWSPWVQHQLFPGTSAQYFLCFVNPRLQARSHGVNHQFSPPTMRCVLLTWVSQAHFITKFLVQFFFFYKEMVISPGSIHWLWW